MRRVQNSGCVKLGMAVWSYLFLLQKSFCFIGQADLQDSHIGKGTEGIEERIEQMEETDESGRKSIRN